MHIMNKILKPTVLLNWTHTQNVSFLPFSFGIYLSILTSQRSNRKGIGGSFHERGKVMGETERKIESRDREKKRNTSEVLIFQPPHSQFLF